jgi:hypothetical protein
MLISLVKKKIAKLKFLFDQHIIGSSLYPEYIFQNLYNCSPPFDVVKLSKVEESARQFICKTFPQIFAFLDDQPSVKWYDVIIPWRIQVSVKGGDRGLIVRLYLIRLYISSTRVYTSWYARLTVEMQINLLKLAL